MRRLPTLHVKGEPVVLPDSAIRRQSLYFIYRPRIPDAVCTVSDSWWWTERPSETCRMLFQNKI